jgi:hypothetical protein
LLQGKLDHKLQDKPRGQASLQASAASLAVRSISIVWVQTIPGKGWFVILRLYGYLDACFNKTWRPEEIKLQPHQAANQYQAAN